MPGKFLEYIRAGRHVVPVEVTFLPATISDYVTGKEVISSKWVERTHWKEIKAMLKPAVETCVKHSDLSEEKLAKSHHIALGHEIGLGFILASNKDKSPFLAVLDSKDNCWTDDEGDRDEVSGFRDLGGSHKSYIPTKVYIKVCVIKKTSSTSEDTKRIRRELGIRPDDMRNYLQSGNSNYSRSPYDKGRRLIGVGGSGGGGSTTGGIETQVPPIQVTFHLPDPIDTTSGVSNLIRGHGGGAAHHYKSAENINRWRQRNAKVNLSSSTNTNNNLNSSDSFWRTLNPEGSYYEEREDESFELNHHQPSDGSRDFLRAYNNNNNSDSSSESFSLPDIDAPARGLTVDESLFRKNKNKKKRRERQGQGLPGFRSTAQVSSESEEETQRSQSTTYRTPSFAPSSYRPTSLLYDPVRASSVARSGISQSQAPVQIQNSSRMGGGKAGAAGPGPRGSIVQFNQSSGISFEEAIGAGATHSRNALAISTTMPKKKDDGSSGITKSGGPPLLGNHHYSGQMSSTSSRSPPSRITGRSASFLEKVQNLNQRPSTSSFRDSSPEVSTQRFEKGKSGNYGSSQATSFRNSPVTILSKRSPPRTRLSSTRSTGKVIGLKVKAKKGKVRKDPKGKKGKVMMTGDQTSREITVWPYSQSSSQSQSAASASDEESSQELVGPYERDPEMPVLERMVDLDSLEQTFVNDLETEEAPSSNSSMIAHPGTAVRELQTQPIIVVPSTSGQGQGLSATGGGVSKKRKKSGPKSKSNKRSKTEQGTQTSIDNSRHLRSRSDAFCQVGNGTNGSTGAASSNNGSKVQNQTDDVGQFYGFDPEPEDKFRAESQRASELPETPSPERPYDSDSFETFEGQQIRGPSPTHSSDDDVIYDSELFSFDAVLKSEKVENSNQDSSVVSNSQAPHKSSSNRSPRDEDSRAPVVMPPPRQPAPRGTPKKSFAFRSGLNYGDLDGGRVLNLQKQCFPNKYSFNSEKLYGLQNQLSKVSTYQLLSHPNMLQSQAKVLEKLQANSTKIPNTDEKDKGPRLGTTYGETGVASHGDARRNSRAFSPDICDLTDVPRPRRKAKDSRPSTSKALEVMSKKSTSQALTSEGGGGTDDEQHGVAVAIVRELWNRVDPVKKVEYVQETDDEFGLSQRSMCMLNVIPRYQQKSRLYKIHSKTISDLTIDQIMEQWTEVQGDIVGIVEGTVSSRRHQVFVKGLPHRKELQNMTVSHPFNNDQCFHLITHLYDLLIPDATARPHWKDYITFVSLPDTLVRIYSRVNNVTLEMAETEMRYGPVYDDPMAAELD